MPKIKPIKDLRNTNEISKECHDLNEPIFITKNGYQDMVLMSNEYFDCHFNKSNGSVKISNEQNKNQYFCLKNKTTEFGFVRVGCANFDISVSNVSKNIIKIKKIIDKAKQNKIHVLVFSELCLTGYSLRDLFFQDEILKSASLGLIDLASYTKNLNMMIFVGTPLIYNNGIYNCAVGISNGKILGVVPKSYIPNYNEFYEGRQFKSGLNISDKILINDKFYPFGTDILFRCENYYDLCIGVEICEDLWVNLSPSTILCQNGATLICNLSASNELVSKEDYRLNLVKMTSGRLICGYAYASAGNGESTTDVVYSGHNIVCENAHLLIQSKLFENSLIYSDMDIEKLVNERRKTTTFITKDDNYRNIGFELDLKIDELKYEINPNPFLIPNKKDSLSRYRKILKMQALGLKKRVEASKSDCLVIGLSGGLDSTLALLVSKETFKMMNRDLKKVYAITLPCFGTSKRTHDNALALANSLGVSFKEININETIKSHFLDINHDINNQNSTFENAQARERTQVLMDFANDINGLMVGTGDLSELCLGWTTYNGDHMSMYGVNASIPKTLVIELVKTYGLDHPEVEAILEDIILTPISPELLPLNNGQIIQKTEEKIGPYELVDFFIYYFLRHNFSPKKIVYLAQNAYRNKYKKEEIVKWLKIFLKRFYQNQFKRSCLPDGVKVGSVCISPRGDLRMPSDADVDDMLNSID